MSVIAIPKPLRERLGDDGVDALVAVINEANLSARDNLATKSDIAALELKIESTRSEIEKSKSETLKWMFIFWAGQLIAIFAMLKAFLK
ncbi:MAG: hypothetical protein HQL01_02145 [Nitrospirae bacterium]|nr:hypothetical protein [Nitrospirota bacterium]